MSKPRFELFAFWLTSATYRVRVALNLKGLTATEHSINLLEGEQRSESFLKINPLGAIPALIDLEAHTPTPPITQSLAILEFLEDIHPANPILPPGAHARARVRSLSNMLVADTHPLIVPRVRNYLTKTLGQDAAAVRAWQIHWFTTGLQAYEQRLQTEAETGTFSHGDTITMADICLASVMAVLPVFKIEVPEIPTIDRIYRALQTHEAFAKASPHLQEGAPK
jgi:maleylacetoacetate isomerase/maleylpyruvate isomerase